MGGEQIGQDGGGIGPDGGGDQGDGGDSPPSNKTLQSGINS